MTQVGVSLTDSWFIFCLGAAQHRLEVPGFSRRKKIGEGKNLKIPAPALGYIQLKFASKWQVAKCSLHLWTHVKLSHIPSYGNDDLVFVLHSH